MAAGSWTVFGNAKHQLLDGNLDVDGHAFRMVLLTDAYTPDANGHVAWSSLSGAEIANGGGYTTHGKLLAMTSTDSGSGTTTVDCDDVSWPASTISAKYAAVVRDGDGDGALAAGDIPVCYTYLETGGGSVSTTAGTFAVNIHSNGICTLT